MFRKMSVMYAVRPVRAFSGQQICDSHDQGSAEAGSGPVCHLQELLVRLSIPKCLRSPEPNRDGGGEITPIRWLLSLP
jgi:hypothetical protein